MSCEKIRNYHYPIFMLLGVNVKFYEIESPEPSTFSKPQSLILSLGDSITWQYLVIFAT